MARRTREDAQKTRAAILDAAEYIFLERGVARTSLEQIAQRAGVTRGAIYWHFRDKGDVFEAMLARVQTPLADITAALHIGVDKDSLRDGLIRLAVDALDRLAHSEQHRRVYTILFHRSEAADETAQASASRTLRNREVQTILETYFEAAQQRGELRPGLTPQQAAWAFRSLMLGIYSDWLRDPSQFHLEQDGIPVARALIGGLLRSEDDAMGAPRPLETNNE